MIPGNLRVKLSLAFAGVILLCLTLAGTTFALLLEPYQTQQALSRLGSVALPLAIQVRMLEEQGAQPDEMGAFLEDQAADLNVRLLLVRLDDSVIVYDTDDTLANQVLAFQGTRQSQLSPVIEGTADLPGEGNLAIVSVNAPRPPSPVVRPRPAVSPEPPRRYYVALATPSANLGAEWLQIVRRLSVAGLVSLVVSFLVAGLLARSIARPLAAITRASEAMARGEYNQRIDTHGRDEVARLAFAFNVMAEQVAKSNQTLRAFLADVSHELRTPLTSVGGFAEAILDGTAGDPSSVAEAARIIREDAHRMGHMVEDLLYLSKIESGQVEMDVQPVNLSELVSEAARHVHLRLGDRDLSVVAGDTPAVIVADPRRIGQILDNLLTNAVHYSPAHGQISVVVSTSDSEARVRVHNTGSFIRVEDRDRIFQRFFRGSADGEGTGLGLAIASEIARSHGGRIDLETTAEHGTAFTLVLPLAVSRGSAHLAERLAGIATT